MKVVAFLPVKGTSERIENKNTRILDGKPLFLHTLEKLVQCSFIDEVYLDTESEIIVDLASEVKCKVLMRDPKLATNKTDGHQLFFNEVKQVDADIYIQILGTSPFIKPETIQKGIDVLTNSSEYDSVVLVKREKQYTWNPDTLLTNYDLNNIPNSFTLPDTIIETMGLYIVRKDTAYSTQRRIGDKPYMLDASSLEAIDVNYPDDFELASYIAAGKREDERKLLRNLAQLLTSPMLSDIMDDLGIENKVIKGMKLNIDGKKVLGRAKTLKIKERTPTDTNSIYDALLTYKTIVPNDIIVVENELPQYAYFGELNANLALRAGASGAIIGGMTRDHSEVNALQFPVFSKGYNCQDIKHKGTVAHYNKQVQIENVTIDHQDLIFGDGEGVIVIPQKYEAQILELSKEVIKKERKIVAEVANGVDVLTLRERHGDF
ncbi:CMP-N-acetylneuraminic acid synthetase [Mucilaginibacter oryzae]|uniref:CMP-N-acetylneuraminic acid synthetase n=1 Tax=Mucilaginibacter oryzae TaxID=468058 RepID=A0A316H994_9SPHI|nr:cytidyltransferase [Mucilaginibacter oryzae]PWK77739.1 CMP-N-acetylneuraminic acid synthetase [Mucilaginibacter oryzae]